MPIYMDGTGGEVVRGLPDTSPTYTAVSSNYQLPDRVAAVFIAAGINDFGIDLNDFDSVDELYDRTGTAFNGGTDVREYARHFRVMTNNIDLTPVDVCQHPALPQPFDPYRNSRGMVRDPYALMVNSSAVREFGAGNVEWRPWIVTCLYTTALPEHGPGFAYGWPPDPFGEQSDPSLARPHWYWDEETVQYPMPRDLDGRPYVTSANVPFVPAPTIMVTYPILVVVKNELSYSKARIESYAGAVNAAAYLGHPPGAVQCYAPKPVVVWRGPLRYYRVSYRLRFKPTQVFLAGDNTFQPRILDAGYHQLGTVKLPVLGVPGAVVEVSGMPVPIFTVPGQSATVPVLLDGAGRRKLPEAGGPDAGRVVPEFVRFRAYGTADFSTIIPEGLVN